MKSAANKSCALVSFRLGLADGVSIVADRWGVALGELGFDIVTVAGEGPVDRIVPGLAIGATEPPTQAELGDALDDIDLVIVENLCTIPLNLAASHSLGAYLAGRPAIMHHHDPPWQRDRFSHIDELPLIDGAWRHVTINELTRHQMAARGIEAVTIYNPFLTEEPFGDRRGMRAALGIDETTLLVTHPVRAIARKNIPMALRLAEELHGTYWLLGQAEEGYDEQLAWLLSTASVPVIHRGAPSIADIYAASDVIVFPSLWEGFGNPPIEAAIHRKPVIVGDYPVATELQALGFEWFRPSDLDQVAAMVMSPDPGDEALLDANRDLALRKFSIASSRDLIGDVIDRAGWFT